MSAHLDGGDAQCKPWHIPSMAHNRIRRPRDPMRQVALFNDFATGQVEDLCEDGKNPPVVEFVRSALKKGGKAQVDTLTPKQPQEIARKAAVAR